jgi:hypothetical protein
MNESTYVNMMGKSIKEYITSEVSKLVNPYSNLLLYMDELYLRHAPGVFDTHRLQLLHQELSRVHSTALEVFAWVREQIAANVSPKLRTGLYQYIHKRIVTSSRATSVPCFKPIAVSPWRRLN